MAAASMLWSTTKGGPVTRTIFAITLGLAVTGLAYATTVVTPISTAPTGENWWNNVDGFAFFESECRERSLDKVLPNGETVYAGDRFRCLVVSRIVYELPPPVVTTVEFTAGPILDVITTDEGLDDTDFFCKDDPWRSYPTGMVDRGLPSPSDVQVTSSGGFHTVEMVQRDGAFDQVRIVTKCVGNR